jgi:DinB superfamily
MSDFIADFAASPARLTVLLERIIAAGKLDVPRAEAKWTPRFIVHHLADVEALQSMRIITMLSIDNATIIATEQDAWAAAGEYAKRDPLNSLGAFVALRKRSAELLGLLSTTQLERVGTHPKRGQFTIESFAKFVVWHDETHFAQLEESLV